MSNNEMPKVEQEKTVIETYHDLDPHDPTVEYVIITKTGPKEIQAVLRNDLSDTDMDTLLRQYRSDATVFEVLKRYEALAKYKFNVSPKKLIP